MSDTKWSLLYLTGNSTDNCLMDSQQTIGHCFSCTQYSVFRQHPRLNQLSIYTGENNFDTWKHNRRWFASDLWQQQNVWKWLCFHCHLFPLNSGKGSAGSALSILRGTFYLLPLLPLFTSNSKLNCVFVRNCFQLGMRHTPYSSRL